MKEDQRKNKEVYSWCQVGVNRTEGQMKVNYKVFWMQIMPNKGECKKEFFSTMDINSWILKMLLK